MLDVAVGAASTADSFSAEYNALAPETYFGESIETRGRALRAGADRDVREHALPTAGRRIRRWLRARLLLDVDTLWRDDQLDPVRAY